MSFLVQYMVPIFYMALLSWVLTRIPWIQKAGFASRFVVFFFITKCIAGFAYNWVAIHYIPNRGDIGPFFDDGLAMYHTFLQSPATFFQNWRQGFSYNDLNALDSNSGFIRSAFEIIKTIHFLFSFITFGSLAGNTVIFNFLAVLCSLYCWQYLRQQLGKRGILTGLLFFFLPSMFFYTTGILKEGLVISLLCLIIPLSHQLLFNKFSLKSTVALLMTIGFLIALKFFVGLIWLFCMLVWWLIVVYEKQKWFIIPLTVIIAITAFFYSHYVVAALDFPGYMVNRQQEFLALPAASAMPISVLGSEPSSFVRALPVAYSNVLFKPLPGQGGKSMYLLFSVEMICFWLGILLLLWKRKKVAVSTPNKALAITCLLFASINLLVIGLIVPNIGAMMRYRSIFFPFLAVSVLILSNSTNPFRQITDAIERFITTKNRIKAVG